MNRREMLASSLAAIPASRVLARSVEADVNTAGTKTDYSSNRLPVVEFENQHIKNPEQYLFTTMVEEVPNFKSWPFSTKVCKGWELLGLAKVWVDRDDAVGFQHFNIKGIEWGEMWLAKCRNADPQAYPGVGKEYPSEFFVLLSSSTTERQESNWSMMVPGIEYKHREPIFADSHAKEQEDHQLTRVAVVTQSGHTLTGYKLNHS